MAYNLRSQEDAVFLYNQQTQEIGSLLKKAREELSLSLEEVSSRLHICKTYLLALEEGHFDKLPGKVYLFGFLRRYAKSLCLDSQELVRRIERASPDDFHLSHLPLAKAEDQFPQKKYIIYSSFIVSLFVLSYLIYQAENKTIEPTLLIDQRDVSTFGPIVSEPSASEEPITSIVSEPAAEPFEESLPALVLYARHDCWIKIVNQTGKKICTKLLKQDEEYLVPDFSGLLLTTGNAGGLDILVNGKKRPSLGLSGQVIKNIPLDSYRS